MSILRVVYLNLNLGVRGELSKGENVISCAKFCFSLMGFLIVLS